MKKAIGLSILLGFLASIVSAQDQNKNPTHSVYNTPIYEYEGLVPMRDHLWMQFETFTKNNSAVRAIYVLPENLKIKLREDGLEITTLDADLPDASSYFALAVTLLVPNNQDLESWNGYLTKLRQELKARGAIENARLDFVNPVTTRNPNSSGCNEVNGSGGVVIIKTRVKNTECSKKEGGQEYICEARVNLQNITVKLDSDLENNKPVFEVEWGLCHVVEREFNPDSLNDYIKAPQLVVWVKSEALLEEWNRRIGEWQNKIEPHRVLPPTTSD